MAVVRGLSPGPSESLTYTNGSTARTAYVCIKVQRYRRLSTSTAYTLTITYPSADTAGWSRRLASIVVLALADSASRSQASVPIPGQHAFDSTLRRVMTRLMPVAALQGSRAQSRMLRFSALHAGAPEPE